MRGERERRLEVAAARQRGRRPRHAGGHRDRNNNQCPAHHRLLLPLPVSADDSQISGARR